MSEKSKDKIITVFIPTFNGERYIKECIDSILVQKLPDDYSLEILVIDSGSTDKTLNILESYNNKINLKKIPNNEFGHGATRQLAAEISQGEFIVYLTQDATPSNDTWLINMIEPFFITDLVGCVFGRQIPRKNAAPTIKREVLHVFQGLGSPDTISLHRDKSLVDQHKVNKINSFFSDVNSAVRRSLLIGKIPFRNVNYAEDHALAQDMIKHGFIKAYTPSGSVWHSNEYTPKEYFHRKFDEYIGLQESVGSKNLPSLKSLLLGWIKPTMTDWRFIIKDRQYALKSKVVWFIEAPLYNIADRAGRYSALRFYKNSSVRDKLSLEKKSRK